MSSTTTVSAATYRTNQLKKFPDGRYKRFVTAQLSYIQSISRGLHPPREHVDTENNGQRFRQAETPHPAEERGDTYRLHRRGRLYRLAPDEWHRSSLSVRSRVCPPRNNVYAVRSFHLNAKSILSLVSNSHAERTPLVAPTNSRDCERRRSLAFRGVDGKPFSGEHCET